jgi:RsbT co-antagonist protein rsbRD N-terminal domain
VSKVGTMSAMNECGGSAKALQVLEQERAPIVDAACESLRQSRTHYESAGQEETRRRVEVLYDELLGALSSRDLGNVLDYARKLAAERFESGYDLSEVQGAFNALEEATWTVLCARLQPTELAFSLGLVSTVLGAAKDALGREYVSLASQTHAPSLDLRALFTGDAGG